VKGNLKEQRNSTKQELPAAVFFSFLLKPVERYVEEIQKVNLTWV